MTAHQINYAVKYSVCLHNKSRKIVISTHFNKPLNKTFSLISINILSSVLKGGKISSISHGLFSSYLR